MKDPDACGITVSVLSVMSTAFWFESAVRKNPEDEAEVDVL